MRLTYFATTLIILSAVTVSVLGSTEMQLHKRQEGGDTDTTTDDADPSETYNEAGKCNPACSDNQTCADNGSGQWTCQSADGVSTSSTSPTPSPTTKSSAQPQATPSVNIKFPFPWGKGRNAKRCNPACQDSEICVKAGKKQWLCMDQNTFQAMRANGTISRRGGKRRGRGGAKQDRCNPACLENQKCRPLGPGQWSCQDRGRGINGTISKLGRGQGKGRGKGLWNLLNQKNAANGTGLGWSGRWGRNQKHCKPACQTEEFCIKSGPGEWSCRDQAAIMVLINNGSFPFPGIFGGGKRRRGRGKNHCKPACQENEQCTKVGPRQWTCQGNSTALPTGSDNEAGADDAIA